MRCTKKRGGKKESGQRPAGALREFQTLPPPLPPCGQRPSAGGDPRALAGGGGQLGRRRPPLRQPEGGCVAPRAASPRPRRRRSNHEPAPRPPGSGRGGGHFFTRPLSETVVHLRALNREKDSAHRHPAAVTTVFENCRKSCQVVPFVFHTEKLTPWNRMARRISCLECPIRRIAAVWIDFTGLTWRYSRHLIVL